MNVTEFKRFAKIFVPYYEDMCKISGKMSHVSVKVNHVRELLCREFPDECAMLTAPFIEWLREPLVELDIDILFGFSLDEKEGRIIHYLMEAEL